LKRKQKNLRNSIVESSKITRRGFLSGAAATAVFTIVPCHVLGRPGRVSPSEKLNVACIGVGGMGASDVGHMSSENIVAFCDVDFKHAAGTFKRYPNVKK